MLWVRQQELLKAYERIPKRRRMRVEELRRKLHKEIECTEDEVTFTLHTLFAALVDLDAELLVGDSKRRITSRDWRKAS